MTVRGKCHCGRTEFQVSEPPTQLNRCTCTFCSKRGVLWAYYPRDKFQLVSTRDQVRYGDVNKHYHCGLCGCGTYSDTPDWSAGEAQPDARKIGVNARLFEDFDIEALPVETIDGRNSW